MFEFFLAGCLAGLLSRALSGWLSSFAVVCTLAIMGALAYQFDRGPERTTSPISIQFSLSRAA